MVQDADTIEVTVPPSLVVFWDVAEHIGREVAAYVHAHAVLPGTDLTVTLTHDGSFEPQYSKYFVITAAIEKYILEDEWCAPTPSPVQPVAPLG